MKRRFNFTERHRIEQEHVTVKLNEAADGGVATFDAKLDLADITLPRDALVVIEAFRGRSIVTFPWGTVGNLRQPEDRRLTNMPGNPQFRIKVVAADGSGVLLAMANRIRPHREEHHGAFVWLEESHELGKEVWRLDFGDGNPTLMINSTVGGIGAAVQKDGAFRGLVMPEVLRAMLVRAIIVDEADLDDDEGDWAQLMRFVRNFHDAPLPFEGSGDGALGRRESQEFLDWINEAVKAFTQKQFPATDFYADTLEGR